MSAADGICEGSCNSRWRKAQALYQAALAAYDQALADLKDGDEVPEPPEAPDIQPWRGEPVYCTRCQSVIRSELAELDDLASGLAALPPGISAASDSRREPVKVSGSRPAPSPSPGADDLDELAGWLREWEAIAKGDGGPRPRRGFLATEITTICGWLYHHFDPLITNPEIAADFGSEIRRWHRELTAKTHSASFARHVKQPCPKPPSGCGRYTLWEKVGEDYISCVNPDCNRRLTRAELEAATAA